MVRHLNNFSMSAPNVYAKSARFDGSARALTEDEIFKLAPSVFAVDKHFSRTDRYRAIPTIEVVRGLIKEGFSVVGARQGTVRDESREDFTKHMLRLRKLDDNRLKVGDNVFEMYLKNANDGSASYEHLAGIFRIACENSLVSMVGEVEHKKVRHTGNVVHKVIETTYEVLQTAERVLAAPQDWGQIRLDREEAKVLARAAHTIRFGSNDDGSVIENGIVPQQLLTPRRADDTQPNLWNVFNVIQENTVKGGMSGYRYDSNNRLRMNTTREVRGIDQNTNLNKALWQLAEGMAALKAA